MYNFSTCRLKTIKLRQIPKLLHSMIRTQLCNRFYTLLYRICNWNEYECPKNNKKWRNTVDDANVKISDRITRLVDEWQRKYHILDTIDTEILQVFSNEFGLLENQVREIECKHEPLKCRIWAYYRYSKNSWFLTQVIIQCHMLRHAVSFTSW